MFLVPQGKMMIAIIRGGGGGQRVMIEIIISINDENDGRPLNRLIKSNFGAFQNLVGKHSVAGAPASLHNLTKSVSQIFIIVKASSTK